jgi:tetratricopeptide (TPR) repeat protein
MMAERNSEAETLFFKGLAAMQSGEPCIAEACFLEAISINPSFAEAYSNLGFLLSARGALAFAEECYRLSIIFDPMNAVTHLNMGVLLDKQKQFDAAELYYKEAIKLDGKYAIAWSNLGVLYASTWRDDEAEQCYRTAIAIDKEYVTAKFNLSYLLLRQGRFAEGWLCLESRKWYQLLEGQPLDTPRWRGESLDGKRLLICFEAGYGDVIQFCRYVMDLKKQGVIFITLICHPPLVKLLTSLKGLDEVIAFDQDISKLKWDFWTPLLSIPYHLKTRTESIPAKIPYLCALEEDMQKWRTQIPKQGLNIGLVWKGNPLFENDAERSLPCLSILEPLWDVSDVNFISLQKDMNEEAQGNKLSKLAITNLGVHLKDFADTAAVIHHLDLVISVDTSVAHLTGALGKPCWVLLPHYKPDWRWLKDRTDSPWYPTMRLFRQASRGNWTDTIHDVREALKSLAIASSKSLAIKDIKS